MNERSGNKSGLVLLFLTAVVIAGAWFFFQRSGAGEATAAAIDETVDVFVPDAQEFERRTKPIDEARRVTDAINARQAQTRTTTR
ncbi:MAG: hypothetical protein ACYTGG_10155 [Planctomycetota bacterium]|jgi:hypothetical protein